MPGFKNNVARRLSIVLLLIPSAISFGRFLSLSCCFVVVVIVVGFLDFGKDGNGLCLSTMVKSVGFF